MSLVALTITALRAAAGESGTDGTSAQIAEEVGGSITAEQLSRVGREHLAEVAAAMPDHVVSYHKGTWVVLPMVDAGAHQVRRLGPTRKDLCDAGNRLYAALKRVQDDPSDAAEDELKAACRHWARTSADAWRSAAQMRLQLGGAL